jgi:hypothetical protein
MIYIIADQGPLPDVSRSAAQSTTLPLSLARSRACAGLWRLKTTERMEHGRTYEPVAESLDAFALRVLS